MFSECFMDDKELPGYDLATHQNVTSQKECQVRYCQYNKQCSAFVYIHANETCILKKHAKRFLKVVHLINSTGKVFGPKYCPGKMTQMALLRKMT